MNWKTFTAMLSRDAHVARRNALTMFLQIMLQPLLFVFVFGQVMVRSGMMGATYKSMLLPGIMALAMLMTGVTAVSMPIIMELITKEIEDRLLAPMETKWLAVEKIVAGMVQSLIAGSVVLPAAWLAAGTQHRRFLRPSPRVRGDHAAGRTARGRGRPGHGL